MLKNLCFFNSYFFTCYHFTISLTWTDSITSAGSVALYWPNSMKRFIIRICHVLIAHIMYLFYFYSSYNLFINWGQNRGQDLWQSLWRHLLKRPYAAVLVFRLLLSFDYVFFLIARNSQNKLWLYSCFVRQLTYFFWLNSSCLTNSCTGTSSALAIAMRASRLGWVVLVTHLEIVAWSLPSLSANHLLFRSCSARTILIRFNFAMIIFSCSRAKIQIIIHNSTEYT